MANPVPVTYSSPVQKVAGGKWFSRTAGVSAFVETGNVDPAYTAIEGADGSEPAIALRPFGSYHIHFLFEILNCAGKRPVFTVDSRDKSSDYHSSFRPVYSYDGENWVKASSVTQLQSPRRVVFQFDEIFTQDRVFVASHMVYMLARSDALATRLKNDTSGMVYPSLGGDGTGTIGISLAETTRGIQVGSNPMYGFRLSDSSQTPPGGKRRLLLTMGVHGGEILDGWMFRAIIEFFMTGVGAKADLFRKWWDVYAYWNISPNSRKAGEPRINPTRGEDPNRDWGSNDGATPYSFTETRVVRDAVFADLTSVHAHFDMHSSGGFIYESACNYYLDSNQSLISAYKSRFDALYPVPLWLDPSEAVNTLGRWSKDNLATQLNLTMEPALGRGKGRPELDNVGIAYASALADMTEDGVM